MSCFTQPICSCWLIQVPILGSTSTFSNDDDNDEDDNNDTNADNDDNDDDNDDNDDNNDVRPPAVPCAWARVTLQ